MAEEGPMAQISLAGSEGALKGAGVCVVGGLREAEEGRRGEEHKDRSRQTVKQSNETCFAPSHSLLMRKFETHSCGGSEKMCVY